MDPITEETKKCANPECNDKAMEGSDMCEKCAPKAETAPESPEAGSTA